MIDNHQFPSNIGKKPVEKHAILKFILTLIFVFLVIFLGLVAAYFVYITTDLHKRYPIPGLIINEEALSDGTEVKKTVKKIITISYQDGDFSPNPATIKVGTTVHFLNTGSDNMWVASNPHPEHSDLAGFDQRGVARSGESYDYLFLIPGQWEYHNHILPQTNGKIIVKE